MGNWNTWTLLVGMSHGAATQEKSVVAPQKADPTQQSWLRACVTDTAESRGSGRYSGASVRCSMTHHDQKMETTQMRTSGYAKCALAILGILRSHKKEWSADPCYHMEEPWKQAQWRKPDIKGQIHDPTLMKEPRVRQIGDSIWEVTGGRGWGGVNA